MSFKKKEISDDPPALADDRDDGVAAPAASDRGGSGPSISKRQFLRGATVGAGSLAVSGVSLQYGTRNARALAPAIPIAGFAAGAAIAYLMDSDTTPYLGDSRDYSNYTGADALHQAIATGAVDMKSADERVMTSIQNNITTSQNVALAKGKAAIIEEMNAGNDETAANTAMQEAIDSYYATIQANIYTHASAQLDQMVHHLKQVIAHANLDTSIFVFDGHGGVYDEAGLTISQEYPDQTTTLLDGSTARDPHVYLLRNGTNDAHFGPLSEYVAGNNAGYGDQWKVTDPSDGSEIMYLTWAPYVNALNSVTSERDNVISTLSGFVTDVYNNWEPGEIPTEDLVDPITASTELRQNYDGYQAQGAHAAMLGIPTTAEQSVNLTVHTADGDRNIWADLYTEYVPTDGSGTEVGFQSGQTYDPSTWDKPLYIAYEYTEETQDGTTTSTDFVQLEDSFTIDVIEDKNGNEVNSFQTVSRNNQTADVTKLQEELDQLREAQLEMQEEAQSGGGGGFVDGLGFGGIPGEGVLVAIVGIVVVLLGQSDN